MSDVWLFLKEFARHPGRVGAVAPSGPALAERIVAAAGIQPGQVVIEIGAGTGPFTQVIRERHGDAHFAVLEPGAELAARLRDRFPDLPVFERYAADLPEVLAELGHERVDRVVSGLPWAIFPDDVQDATLDAVARCLAPGGRMVTFQYVHSQVLPLARRFIGKLEARFSRVTRTPVTWRNVPPAFVFVCEK